MKKPSLEPSGPGPFPAHCRQDRARNAILLAGKYLLAVPVAREAVCRDTPELMGTASASGLPHCGFCRVNRWNSHRDREPSANFMPKLWQQIEARQTYTFSFRRMANALVTAAVALSIVLGVYMSIPTTNGYSTQSYIEALAEANALDAPDIIGPVHLDPADSGR